MPGQLAVPFGRVPPPLSDPGIHPGGKPVELGRRPPPGVPVGAAVRAEVADDARDRDAGRPSRPPEGEPLDPQCPHPLVLLGALPPLRVRACSRGESGLRPDVAAPAGATAYGGPSVSRDRLRRPPAPREGCLERPPDSFGHPRQSGRPPRGGSSAGASGRRPAAPAAPLRRPPAEGRPTVAGNDLDAGVSFRQAFRAVPSRPGNSSITRPARGRSRGAVALTFPHCPVIDPESGAAGPLLPATSSPVQHVSARRA